MVDRLLFQLHHGQRMRWMDGWMDATLPEPADKLFAECATRIHITLTSFLNYFRPRPQHDTALAFLSVGRMQRRCTLYLAGGASTVKLGTRLAQPRCPRAVLLRGQTRPAWLVLQGHEVPALLWLALHQLSNHATPYSVQSE